MSTLYFSTLRLAEHSHVFIWGGKSAQALICLLAAESARNERIALVLSDAEQVYPIEGKVLVSPEVDLIKELLKIEETQVIHLASAVKNDILQPYDAGEIKKILAQCEKPVLPFLYIQKERQNLKKIMQTCEKPLCLCVINYQKTELELVNTVKRANASETTINRRISQIIERHCAHFNELNCAGNSILLIDQVKTLLDENKLLSILRKFNEQFAGKIYIGNSSQYRIKEI